MQHEAISIRKEHAWSIPTDSALDVIAKLSPLVELGAGKDGVGWGNGGWL